MPRAFVPEAPLRVLRKGPVKQLLLGVSLFVAACGSNGAAALPGDEQFVDASGFDQEVADAIKVTPVPPGASFPTMRAVDPAGRYGVGGGTKDVQDAAICLWFDHWLGGLAVQDEGQVAAAQAMAETFPTWKTYVDNDRSYSDLLDNVIDKAELGDPSAMRTFTEANCEFLTDS